MKVLILVQFQLVTLERIYVVTEFIPFSEIDAVDELYVFERGKYKGIPLSVVLERDPDYLFWSERNVLTFILSDDTWTKALQSKFDALKKEREAKIELVTSVNESVQELSEQERNKRRKKYFAKKEKEQIE